MKKNSPKNQDQVTASEAAARSTSAGGSVGVSTTTTPEKRRPVKSIHVGDVNASIWSRQSQTRGGTNTYYSISFERSYKNRDGGYGYSKSFNVEDLGRLVTAAQEASEFVRHLIEPSTMLDGSAGEQVPE